MHVRRYSSPLAALLVASLSLISLNPRFALAAELSLGIPADGASFRGALVGCDSAWKLSFALEKVTREVAAGDLALWGNFVEPTRTIQIVLPLGGLIATDWVRIEKENVQGASAIFENLSIPLELASGIIFRPPFDLAKQDQLRTRIAAAGGQTDRVLLDNGDELTGTIAALDEKGLTLQTDVGNVTLETRKLAAAIFNPTLLKPLTSRGLRVLVGFQDGSRATATKLEADKTSATLQLAGGLELKTATDRIVALQPLGGRVEYLSDMKPISYRHIPFLILSWPYSADRSVLGGQLRAGGKLFAKGLGMHSPARITYDLKGTYRQFQADLAIDDEAGQGGSAVFRVFVDDGSGTWQEQYTSETIRGGEPPVPISVDLAGAKRISLLVDYADRGDELDHADWLNARLVR